MEVSRRQQLQQSLTALSCGDREAFTPVFEILWPVYRRFARRWLSEADADDAAQEALLKLFVRANEFDIQRDASAFAIGVAYHEIRTWRRKRWRRREEALDRPSQDPSLDGPLEAVTAREADDLIDWGMARLSETDRQTLIHYSLDERTAGTPPATFRKRVQRALERLRAILRLR